MSLSGEATYFQKGLGLKAEASTHVARDYASGLVDLMRSSGFTLALGRVTFLLAKEFGFCYGVERAVEYAYEARAKFPDRRVLLTNELIHNPHVNRRMEELGIEFLRGYDDVRKDDVVIIPAFGVTVEEMDILRRSGCIMVDTTCGSVMNVWKNVERYARDRFTTVIHGKSSHEETLATCSRATRHPGAHYVVVRDMEEGELLASAIEDPGARGALLERLGASASPGFDPDRHLERVGVANQTTMLMSESLAIAERLRHAFLRRYGEAGSRERFRNFDTICSATQERQDAVEELLGAPLDRMIIVGGFNSSNTNHLAEMCEGRVTAYHIEDESGIIDARRISHKPPRRIETVVTSPWLPEGPCRLGITAGASTPNNKIGTVVERMIGLFDLPRPEISAAVNVVEREPLPIVRP